MTSIYQTALGSDFEKLHPKIQERFGFSSEDGVAQIGRGVMEEVSRGSFLTIPFLMVGTTRNLLFPEQGENVPFSVNNYAYVDSFGRETVTWNRVFDLDGKQRRFDATMIYGPERQTIIDYLGNKQHVSVDLEMWADDEGGINIKTGEQRCYEGPIKFKFPNPLTGHARVREWWDEELDRFRISVKVSNPIIGKIFHYRGSFEAETVKIDSPDDIPTDMRPSREIESE